MAMACLLWLFVAGRVAAHDSFVIPDTFQTDAGREVSAVFFSSDEFPKRDAPTLPDRVRAWRTLDVRGGKLLKEIAIEGKDLTARMKFSRPGTHIIAVELHPKPITMPFAEFEHYLTDEGARGHIVDAVRAAGGPQIEHYTKFAKTIVTVGPDADPTPPPAVGHVLEIVPLSNPATWRLGEEVVVRIMHNGHPETNVRVSSGRADLSPHTYIRSYSTREDGLAYFEFDRYGVWYLRAYVISRVTDPRSDHAWESTWASLTFEIRNPQDQADCQARPGKAAPHGDAHGPHPTPTAANASPIDRMLAEVAAVHGGAGPWAVVGYRMGERALRELGLPRGSFDLEVTHEGPLEVQYTCISDGIQAATGATAGKLNLKLVEAPNPNLRTTFRRRSTGATVVLRPTQEFIKTMLDLPRAQLAAKGREAARMPEAQAFEKVPSKAEAKKGGDSKSGDEPAPAQEPKS